MISDPEINNTMLNLTFKKNYLPHVLVLNVKNVVRTITSAYLQQKTALSFTNAKITSSQGKLCTAVVNKFILIWWVSD